eukprot:TRINITY_DN19994_c0_g1_i1.p1 TRINITY_DN19994_c0_g1~~TRINITY_DN19994_c0_g1_i1.p1  ORF type:complete len:200 (+),score=39.30 TRINITY_DN19994_c0_g1_i1:340-939(+)
MGNPSQKEYAAFEEKVRRTVFIDNLSPQATVPVLKMALGQFGNVVSVHVIPNYTESRNIPQCALVEMENTKQAKCIIEDMTNFPFMMSGMPRPVRARAAEPEMFGERPARPGKKIQCRWVDPKDPDFEIAKKLKHLTQKHAAEASLVLENQLEEEEKLAKQQAETLKTNYKKIELIDGIMTDGTIQRLARHYQVNIADD